MRPRISQLEAKFILECLALKKEETEQLIERKKQLDVEMRELKKLLFLDTRQAMKQGYREKKQELQRLEQMSYTLFKRIQLFDILIAKYSMLANGEKHKGRYPSRATSYQWQLSTI